MTRNATHFHPLERRALGGLTALYGIRMLGLFMLLPILALYSGHLTDATPTLIGLALGIYGFTQAMFQIPFGMLSDRWGRKPIIALGLVLLCIGSVIAADATTMYGVVAGRALQGSGAISGVIMALLADRTREEVRTRAMATVGISIGGAIGASMVVGPIVAHHFGLTGVFLLTALLALLGLVVLWKLVPAAPVRSHKDVGMDFRQLTSILKRLDLARLDYSIFALHGIFTALFVVLPLKLSGLGFSSEEAGWVYLPIMLTSFVAMTPLIIIAEKHRRMKPVFIGTVVLLIATLALMYAIPAHSWLILALLWLFFFAFNLMESVLPSMISKVAPAGGKGTALGIYSTSQFLGTTIGGAAGGVVADYLGASMVFLFVTLLAIIWLLVVWGMKPPRHLSSEIAPIKGDFSNAQALLSQLLKVPGVADAMVATEENVAYLKVDKETLDREALNRLVG